MFGHLQKDEHPCTLFLISILQFSGFLYEKNKHMGMYVWSPDTQCNLLLIKYIGRLRIYIKDTKDGVANYNNIFS